MGRHKCLRPIRTETARNMSWMWSTALLHKFRCCLYNWNMMCWGGEKLPAYLVRAANCVRQTEEMLDIPCNHMGQHLLDAVFSFNNGMCWLKMWWSFATRGCRGPGTHTGSLESWLCLALCRQRCANYKVCSSSGAGCPVLGQLL